MSDENLVEEFHQQIERLRLSGPNNPPESMAAYLALKLTTMCLRGQHREPVGDSAADAYHAVSRFLNVLTKEAGYGGLLWDAFRAPSEKRARTAVAAMGSIPLPFETRN